MLDITSKESREKDELCRVRSFSCAAHVPWHRQRKQWEHEWPTREWNTLFSKLLISIRKKLTWIMQIPFFLAYFFIVNIYINIQTDVGGSVFVKITYRSHKSAFIMFHNQDLED